MGVGKKQELVLFALGNYLGQANTLFSDKPLEVSVSKIIFIELLLDSGILRKSKRALYKNLEDLEKKRYIIYDNKFLGLTKKGLKLFKSIEKGVKPFIVVSETVKGIPKARKVQSRFK